MEERKINWQTLISMIQLYTGDFIKVEDLLDYNLSDLYLELLSKGADPDSCIDINRYKFTLSWDPRLWNIKE